MKQKNKKAFDPNYDFESQKQPKTPMGQGQFANMPTEVKLMTFGKNHDRRSGIINSFTNDIVETSEIHENQR